MRYIIKMTLQGSFPGSPDYDYFELDMETWDKIRSLVFPNFEMFDTLEELNTSEKGK